MFRNKLKVPSADGTANSYSRDVVGHKEDAAVETVGTTKSLMAYLKGLIGLHNVPTADATTNTSISDVVGNKTDAGVQAVTTTKTLMAYLKACLDILAGTTGLAAWPAGAAPANGVSMAEALRYLCEGNCIGSTFWVKKTLVSSAIVTGGVDITGVSSGGELEIEDIILKTDSTGLATGTNLEIETNNARGLADVLVEAVANLGANKTIALTDASVSDQKTIIETGKKLTTKATGSSCDGSGEIDIYIKFRRLAAGATIAAAA